MIKKEKRDKNISQRENTKVSSLATAPLRHSSVSFKAGRCLESLTKLRQIFVELLCTRALRLLLLLVPQRERSTSHFKSWILIQLFLALHVFYLYMIPLRKAALVIFPGSFYIFEKICIFVKV